MDEYGEEEVVRAGCLDEHYTCLHLAAHAESGEYSQEYLELMTILLNAGADVDETTFLDAMTPLHYAAEYYYPESIALLLDWGADIEEVAGSAFKRGTALSLAIAKHAHWTPDQEIH